MKLKTNINTVFRDLTKTFMYMRKLKIDDFLDKFNYYFTGSDLEKVIKVEKNWKISLVHLLITTESGVYKDTIRIVSHVTKDVKPDYDKKIPAYETVESFIKDFDETTKNDFRILEKYKEQLNKKENQLESATVVSDNLKKQYPEYFL